MTGMRVQLLALTDIATSMFACCFMILLVHLMASGANNDTELSDGMEAATALSIVQRDVLSPQVMVELLHANAMPASGTAIDVFSDRIEVRSSADAIVLPAAEVTKFSSLLRLPEGADVRLYVFSPELYDAVMRGLPEGAARVLEMSVPQALRSVDAPDEDWNHSFVDLWSESLELPEFQVALAALLEGSAAFDSAGNPAGSFAQATAEPGRLADLVTRISAWLRFVGTVCVLAMSMLAVLWIERRRFPQFATEG